VPYLQAALANLLRQRERMAAKVAELDRAIEALRPGAEQERLTMRESTGNSRAMRSKREMQPIARVSRSAGASGDALARAANDRGHTVRSLAEAIGCSAPLLSQARSGVRSISMGLAKKIEAAVGFKATRANWPKLRSDE
jgi:plasmid maintenance system antidote protein VapI